MYIAYILYNFLVKNFHLSNKYIFSRVNVMFYLEINDSFHRKEIILQLIYRYQTQQQNEKIYFYFNQRNWNSLLERILLQNTILSLF